MGRASRRKWEQRIQAMAAKPTTVQSNPMSLPSTYAGYGVQVIAMGLGAWLGPETGLWVALIGLLFFIPLIKEQIESQGWSMFGHRKIFVPIGVLIFVAITWIYSGGLWGQRPLMVAEPKSLITFAREKNEPLKALVLLTIKNLGPPSTLSDFSLRVTLKSGREVKTESLVIGNLRLPNGMQFFQHQHIYEKTGTKLIPTGGTAVGIHLSKLIDLGDPDNFRDATVALHFKDVFGNAYKCTFRVDELENRPFYVPGL